MQRFHHVYAVPVTAQRPGAAGRCIYLCDCAEMEPLWSTIDGYDMTCTTLRSEWVWRRDWARGEGFMDHVGARDPRTQI